MTDEMDIKNTDVQEDDGKIFDGKRLMSTSSQAMLLSWLFLAVIVLFVINLVFFLLSMAGVQFQGAIVSLNHAAASYCHRRFLFGFSACDFRGVVPAHGFGRNSFKNRYACRRK